MFRIFYAIAILLCGQVVAPVSSVASLPVTYDDFVNHLQVMVEEEGVEPALAYLEEAEHESEVALTYCHGLVHEIGHVAYEHYGFEGALKFEVDLCGSGYLHGVVEHYLAEQPSIEAALQSTCEEGDAVCIHGLGHGLMIHTDNDVDASLDYCGLFETDADKIYCSEGVFMENFNIDLSIHSSKFLRVEDPLYPCSEQDALYKGTCYFYAPRFYNHLYPEQYEEALDWCLTAEKGYISDCVRGVGSTAMKLNMDEVEFVEGVCRTAEDLYISSCINGMTSYYIVNYASAGKGEEMCEELQHEESRKACRVKADSMNVYYPD